MLKRLKKRSKEVKITPSNKSFYFTILDKLKAGLNPAKICKDLNISKQNLNYYLRQIKDLGYIEKKGYGVWEVKEVKTIAFNTLRKRSKKTIRGHAFIWTAKTPKNIGNWENILKKSDIPYKLVGSNGFPRIFIKDRKVWLGSKRITIYENRSFYGVNAIESKKYAVISLIEMLRTLENKLDINLKPYVFKPSREHYGIIKNDLAVQCNRTGEKIHIRDNLEGEWLWIDDSLQLGELETGGPKALVRNLQVQKWYNDHKKHNFSVTPTFLMETMNGIQQNQMIHSKNMVSHVKAIQDLSKGVQKWNSKIDKLINLIKKFKE